MKTFTEKDPLICNNERDRKLGLNPLKMLAMEKIFNFPVILDSFVAASTFVAPILNVVTPMLMPVIEALNFKADKSIPKCIKSKITRAAGTLDSIACSGLDHLTEKVPILSCPTPELVEKSKVTASKNLDSATSYIHSFTLVKFVLCAGNGLLAMFLKGGDEDPKTVSKPKAAWEINTEMSSEENTGSSFSKIFSELLGINYIFSIISWLLVPTQNDNIKESKETSTNNHSTFSNQKLTKTSFSDASFEEEVTIDEYADVNNDVPDDVAIEVHSDPVTDEEEINETITENVHEDKLVLKNLSLAKYIEVEKSVGTMLNKEKPVDLNSSSENEERKMSHSDYNSEEDSDESLGDSLQTTSEYRTGEEEISSPGPLETESATEITDILDGVDEDFEDILKILKKSCSTEEPDEDQPIDEKLEKNRRFSDGLNIVSKSLFRKITWSNSK